MISNKILIFLTLSVFFGTTSAFADGMMLSAPYHYIYENSQQAVIRYDESTSTETISILPGFNGDALEFAWILPVPGLPELDQEDSELFQQLRNFTLPERHFRDSDWDGCDGRGDIYYEIPDEGVNVINSQIIGYYQTMTLSSNQAPALIDSLTQWGFLHEDNLEAATELIDSYVQQDWYFVTVKVDSVSFAEAFPQYDDYYGYYAQLEPLKFSFASEQIIYPMRISALSAAESTQVDLFVISDHRTTYPGAFTRYANRFSGDEINRLSGRSYGLIKGLLNDGDFLTHLRRDFRPQDMTEDIQIVPAENDHEYRMIYYSGMPWMTLFLLGPAALWGLYRKFSS